MQIEPDALVEKLAAGAQLLILDVRTKFEYTSGHLPGAVNLPFWKIPFSGSGFINGKDQEIVLYCEHGPRAVLAAKILGFMGYGKTVLLQGHMHRWRRERKELVK